MKRTTRIGVLAALSTATALTLAACTPPLPTVTAEPAPTETQAVLDEARLERVLGSLQKSIDTADAAQDPAQLDGRVEGPALAARTAEYALAKATASTEAPFTPQKIGVDVATTVMGASADWPRSLFVVSNPPEGSNHHLMMVLTQDSARADYKLYGWTRLLPGVTTPTVNAAGIGEAQLAPDQTGLVATPAQAIADYADVLINNEASAANGAFAADAFRTNITNERAQLVQSAQAAGTVTDTAAAGDAPVVALSTKDGGAVVFGTVNYTRVFAKTVEGSKFNLANPALIALNGGNAEITNKVTATYQLQLVMVVPPEGGGQISVIGAEYIPTSVTAE